MEMPRLLSAPEGEFSDIVESIPLPGQARRNHKR
jgi:hypothetical protein